MNPDPIFSADGCRVRDPLYFAPRPETRLVENASLDLLDSHRLSFYLDAKEAESPTLSRCSRSQQLHMLNLSYDGTPTVAAMMHFCAYPQGFFPRFQILTAVVDAPDWKEEAVIEKKRLNGSISDLYDQACAFLQEHGQGYPLQALQELVLNSLIHRDYSEASVQTPDYIIFFSDRVEIWNPIGRPDFSPSSGRVGRAPELPNPTIAAMAQTLLGAQLRGAGLKMVHDLLQQAGLPDLTYYVEDQELCMVVKAAQEDPKDMTSALLEFCAAPRSRQEIADFLHVGTVFYAMQRYVRPLLEAGQLSMTMPEKPQSSHQRFVRT